MNILTEDDDQKEQEYKGKTVLIKCPWSEYNSHRLTHGQQLLISKDGKGYCAQYVAEHGYRGATYFYNGCVITQLNTYRQSVLDYLCDYLSTSKLPPKNSKWFKHFNFYGQGILDIYHKQIKELTS